MPRTRTEMRRIKEVLRLKFELGLSDTQVARSVRLARSTVQEYLHRAAAAGLDYEQARGLDDGDLDGRLFPARDPRNTARPLPDWEAIERELRGRGMTLRLLWQEYLAGQPDGYQYTQFLRHFRAWQQASRPPVMRQVHRAGEALEVDYAGMTLDGDRHGRAARGADFRCLPAVLTADLRRSELDAGPRGLARLHMCVRWPDIGGCPEKLVPDNLRSGVTDACYYDPVLNRSYHELARHYGIAIVPARVRRPRDKSSVESGVKSR